MSSTLSDAEGRLSRDAAPGAIGVVAGSAKAILRLEGAVVLAAASIAYAEIGRDCVLFALLFFVELLPNLGDGRDQAAAA